MNEVVGRIASGINVSTRTRDVNRGSDDHHKHHSGNEKAVHCCLLRSTWSVTKDRTFQKRFYDVEANELLFRAALWMFGARSMIFKRSVVNIASIMRRKLRKHKDQG
jgi:hypothetical protein